MGVHKLCYLERTQKIGGHYRGHYRIFYVHLLKHVFVEIIEHKDLNSLVKLTCEKYIIFVLKYIFDASYSRAVRIFFYKWVCCTLWCVQMSKILNLLYFFFYY